MSRLPIGVGNAASQERFIRAHEGFLREHQELHNLLNKVFIRRLAHPPDEEISKLEQLPDSDPSVIAFEDKVIAARVIFFLGRTAADDFGELLILAGNGYGIGAFKILRGMYERIVTAAFIAKHPAEARVFAEDDAIKKWTLWREYVAAMPELRGQYTGEQIKGLEDRYNEIRAKRKTEICSKCRQPKTQDAWTRVTMADMAKRADAGLAELYASCYLEGTFQSHPTAYGLGRRLRELEGGGYSFNETTEKEARRAVLLAHNLILRLVSLENEYFGLGLQSEIEERLKMFPRVWNTQCSPSA